MLEPKRYVPKAIPVDAFKFDDQEEGNVEALLNWVNSFEDCEITYIPEGWEHGPISPQILIEKEGEEPLRVWPFNWLIRDVEGNYFTLDIDDFAIEFKEAEA